MAAATGTNPADPERYRGELRFASLQSKAKRILQLLVRRLVASMILWEDV